VNETARATGLAKSMQTNHVQISMVVDEYGGVAGLVTSEAGYVPKADEKLHLRGLEVEILKADEKKIHLLRLRKHSKTEHFKSNET